MGEFAGNVLGTGENPVVSASRGHLFVPIEDDNYPSPLKRKLIAVGIIVLAVVLFIIGICISYSSVDRAVPPDMFKLTGKLDEPMSELPYQRKSVKYAGVPFALNAVEEDGRFSAFIYHTSDPVTADGVADVTGTLIERFSSAGDFSDMALSVLTVNDLQKLHGSGSDAQKTYRWTWELGYAADSNSEESTSDLIHLDLYIAAGAGEGTYLIDMYVEARPEGASASRHNQ